MHTLLMGLLNLGFLRREYNLCLHETNDSSPTPPKLTVNLEYRREERWRTQSFSTAWWLMNGRTKKTSKNKKRSNKEVLQLQCKKMRNSSLIQKHSTKQKQIKEMHAINWGIQVKRGLLMRKTFSKKQKIFFQYRKQTKKAGILIPWNSL